MPPRKQSRFKGWGFRSKGSRKAKSTKTAKRLLSREKEKERQRKRIKTAEQKAAKLEVTEREKETDKGDKARNEERDELKSRAGIPQDHRIIQTYNSEGGEMTYTHHKKGHTDFFTLKTSEMRKKKFERGQREEKVRVINELKYLSETHYKARGNKEEVMKEFSEAFTRFEKELMTAVEIDAAVNRTLLYAIDHNTSESDVQSILHASRHPFVNGNIIKQRRRNVWEPEAVKSFGLSMSEDCVVATADLDKILLCFEDTCLLKSPPEQLAKLEICVAGDMAKVGKRHNVTTVAAKLIALDKDGELLSVCPSPTSMAGLFTLAQAKIKESYSELKERLADLLSR